MNTITEEVKKDIVYLAEARLHSIISRAYMYAALLGEGDSFPASLSDNIAPVITRNAVSTLLKSTIKARLLKYPCVKDVEFISDDLIMVSVTEEKA